ncbi:hypothetical protein EPN42_14430 [bacterium]|nr:MAG: hypothetical protein EPN42_14430 [bacterium]
MRFLFTAAALVAALSFTSVGASAQALGVGTSLNGTMAQDIGSKDAKVGQTVTITNVSSADGSNRVSGATMYGHVSAVQRASQGKPGRIEIMFDKLNTANGNSYAVQGQVTHLDVKTKSNALKEAGGAVAGMLVGNYLGKVVGIKGGGLAGAAGGYFLAKNNRENVTVPKGSVVTVKLTEVARRQASR